MRSPYPCWIGTPRQLKVRIVAVAAGRCGRVPGEDPRAEREARYCSISVALPRYVPEISPGVSTATRSTFQISRA